MGFNLGAFAPWREEFPTPRPSGVERWSDGLSEINTPVLQHSIL